MEVKNTGRIKISSAKTGEVFGSVLLLLHALSSEPAVVRGGAVCGRGGQIVVTLTSLRFPGKEVRLGGGNAERTSETHALTSATVVAHACACVR